MNLIDVLLIVVIVLSVWGGYQRGFILGLFGIVTWLASLALTLISYPYVVNWLEAQSRSQGVWTIPLAFLATFLFVRLIVGIIVNWLLGAVPNEIHRNLLNKSMGVFPGLVNGFIYAALLATFLLIAPISDNLSAMARESVFAPKLTEPVAYVEDKLSPIFDDAVKKTISRMEVEPHSEKFVKLPYKVSNPKPRPDLEARMLLLLNEERAKQGLNALMADPEMQVVARAHSADMFARGYFSHYTPEKKDPFDRMRAKKVKFLTAGENLSLARTLIMAHEGLMNSPGHRANILQPAFGRVGIGILDGGIYGIMVTQNFRN
jgi:uncharacterized protein YkwD